MHNLELNVGMLCNNRCVFCLSGDARRRETGWLSAARALSEIREHYRRGCRSLGFLGGEPTVYPHLLECVRAARTLGYRRIALCSNGTRYSDVRFTESLIEAGVTRFGISIHGHRPDIEDELTGVPGNFARKIAGLRHLLRRRAEGAVPDNVSLNPVLSSRNLPHLEAYVEHFMALGVDDIRFNYIWPQSRVERDRSMIPAYRRSMPLILRAMLLNEAKWRIHLTFGAVPRCLLALGGAPLSSGLAERLGARYLSELDDLPTQVSVRGARFNWQARKRDLLKTAAPCCSGCRWRRGCDGVWKSYAALYGLGELRAVAAP